MIKKIFLLLLISLLMPAVLFSEPIVLDNNDCHVYLKDSWEPTVDETGEKYNYSFEITDKKGKRERRLTVKTYGISQAFLTPGHLNLVTQELPPGTNGRTPPGRFTQYDLSTFRISTTIGGVQDANFSPSKKYGLLAFTFNPYKKNEFDAVGFLGFTRKAPRLKWLCNREDKINLFVDPKDRSDKYFSLESPVGWSSDENQMVFVVSWGRTDEANDLYYHGYYLVYIKNLNSDFVISLEPIDFEKMGYKDMPWITKVDLLKETADLTIQKAKDNIRTIHLKLP